MNTTNLQELANEIFVFARHSVSTPGAIKEIIGRDWTDGENRWISDLSHMLEMKREYTDQECDDEAMCIASSMLNPSIEEIAETASADDANFELVETTIERNGYPSHVEKAFTGFSSWEQAKAFAHRYGLRLIWIEKYDGWNLWHRKGTAFEPMEIRECDFGGTCNFESDAEEVLQQLKEVIDSCDDIEEIRKAIERFEPIIEACNSRGDDEVVVTINGDYYDTIIPERVIHFYYDTYTIELAAIK